MSTYYLTGSGVACIWQSGIKWSVTHYTLDGSVEWAEYHRGRIIGGYGIERAQCFTMYYGETPHSPVKKYGIRIPKPDTIVEWRFDFFSLYDKSTAEWPFDVDVDFDRRGVTVFTSEGPIAHAGVWENGVIKRRREKIARGLCGCVILNAKWCGCCRADYLPLPLPIAEELAPELLF